MMERSTASLGTVHFSRGIKTVDILNFALLSFEACESSGCYVIISDLAVSLVFHHFGENAQEIRLRSPDRFSPEGARGLVTTLSTTRHKKVLTENKHM